jgi:HlyD family type I secretion membrane fusion protein
MVAGAQDSGNYVNLDGSARSSIVAGAAIMVVFFVGFGGWAAVAPLSSAIIAPAVIKVEGNRKSVQHLEGGIVRELLVRDGDRVQTGQILVVLDAISARAALGLHTRQHTELRAQEARLLAEQANAVSLSFPHDMVADSADAQVVSVLEAQRNLFKTRQATLSGQISVMRQKIAQTREQITGAEGQLVAQREQLESIRNELQGLKLLFEQGYVPRQRMLELERVAAAFEGQVIETAANIVKYKQSIEELNLQINQLRTDRMQQIAGELRDVQLRLIEVEPRLHMAREALRRVTVTAPSSGTVVGLTVFTEGGVVAAGEKIMEIVPDSGDLIVEATINVEDQKDMSPGMEAEVHLIAYKQRSSPVVRGRVTHVSADRLTDQRSGTGYYLAQVKVDQTEVQRMNEFRMTPGMPALVIVPTGDRTALDYLLQPLTDSFNRAFREQ